MVRSANNTAASMSDAIEQSSIHVRRGQRGSIHVTCGQHTSILTPGISCTPPSDSRKGRKPPPGTHMSYCRSVRRCQQQQQHSHQLQPRSRGCHCGRASRPGCPDRIPTGEADAGPRLNTNTTTCISISQYVSQFQRQPHLSRSCFGAALHASPQAAAPLPSYPPSGASHRPRRRCLAGVLPPAAAEWHVHHTYVAVVHMMSRHAAVMTQSPSQEPSYRTNWCQIKM
jgi:hypothetical protein